MAGPKVIRSTNHCRAVSFVSLRVSGSVSSPGHVDEVGRDDVTARTVITFGTFDVFHVGHVRVLNRAAELGDRLVVGVSSDSLNFAKKDRYPVFTQDERVEIVRNIKVVDAVFVEESLELKRDYVLKYRAEVLVMGDDWAGKFDALSDICEVVYLSRTPSVSTTAIIEHISTPRSAARH